MNTDLVVVGPPSEQEKVGGERDLSAEMKRLAESGAFVSRGDNSGTHTKELQLWQAAGIDPKTVKNREETGSGMGATLNVADQKGAYTLTDRGTYLAQRKNLKLEVLVQGDKSLLNIYTAYVVSPEKHPGVKKAQAEAFVAFMVSPATQTFIGEFKKAEYGESLFFPDAGKTVEQLGG